MPVYHSTLNETDGPVVCGALLLPLKTTIRGPAPQGLPDQPDIIDEAINFYRANVLFRSFEVEGGADRVLCYLTVFIGECLRHCQKFSSKAEGGKSLFIFSKSEFSVPGEAGFGLGGFFTQPQNRTEAETFRAYFRQLREELVPRLIEHIYNEDGSINKFWMAFSRRSFMNIKRC